MNTGVPVYHLVLLRHDVGQLAEDATQLTDRRLHLLHVIRTLLEVVLWLHRYELVLRFEGVAEAAGAVRAAFALAAALRSRGGEDVRAHCDEQRLASVAERSAVARWLSAGIEPMAVGGKKGRWVRSRGTEEAPNCDFLSSWSATFCRRCLTTVMKSAVVFLSVDCSELMTPLLCCCDCLLPASASPAARCLRSFTSVLRCVIDCLMIAVISLISSAGSSNSERRCATARSSSRAPVSRLAARARGSRRGALGRGGRTLGQPLELVRRRLDLLPYRARVLHELRAGARRRRRRCGAATSAG